MRSYPADCNEFENKSMEKANNTYENLSCVF